MCFINTLLSIFLMIAAQYIFLFVAKMVSSVFKLSGYFPSVFFPDLDCDGRSCSSHVLCVQVVSYVLQGRLEEARQMLVKQASLQPASRNMYKLMDNLLSKMPFYNVCML